MTGFLDKVLRDPGAAVRKPAKQPWWQTAKTARQGFMMAALFGLLGMAALIASIFVAAHLWVAAIVWLPLASIHLISAAAVRRRERAPQS